MELIEVEDQTGQLYTDFSAQHISDISAQFEYTHASDGIVQNQRVGQPSAAYNCLAYAIGRTDVWISGEIYDVLVDDYTQVTGIATATVAGHRNTRPVDQYDHISRVVKNNGDLWTTYFCQGKFGYNGVYKTNGGVAEDVYNLERTKYFAPK